PPEPIVTPGESSGAGQGVVAGTSSGTGRPAAEGQQASDEEINAALDEANNDPTEAEAILNRKGMTGNF
ncbi:MAG TPA: hypothetical protein VMY35_09160, partial [Phycisphaerae bacterium]|nr:hypothetical protein [Phycisphaerae bacterium]